jgi:hypothetical protein
MRFSQSRFPSFYKYLSRNTDYFYYGGGESMT